MKMSKKILMFILAAILAFSCACGGQSADGPAATDGAETQSPEASDPPATPDGTCTVSVFVPVHADVAVVSGGKTYYPEGDSNCEIISVPALIGNKISLEAVDGLLYTFRSWTGETTSSERTIEITASEGLYLTMNLDVHYGENIALGAHATCYNADTEGTTLVPSNLTDGSYSTDFMVLAVEFYGMDSIPMADMAVTIDLGDVYDISLVSLAPMRDPVSGELKYGFPNFAAIRVSADGAAYTEVAAQSSLRAPGGHLIHFSFEPVRARYIRVILTGQGRVGLAEVEVR